MAKNEHLTIQEAAKLTKRSMQTIRRGIKAGKIKSTKSKTPQGFHYQIDKSSLYEAFGLLKEMPKEILSEKIANTNQEPLLGTVSFLKKEEQMVAKNTHEFDRLSELLEKMVNQHSEERRNFMKLVNTLQEKIFLLENQMNLLQAPGDKSKSWFQFWK